MLCQYHVTLHESCNLNKYTSFDSVEWKAFGPAGGHTFSHSIQWSCLTPSGLSHCPYSNLLTYTNTHIHTLSDRTAGVFEGDECVSLGCKSDRATFTPIKSVSSQEHMKGTLQGTLFTSLFLSSFSFCFLHLSHLTKAAAHFVLEDLIQPLISLYPWAYSYLENKSICMCTKAHVRSANVNLYHIG